MSFEYTFLEKEKGRSACIVFSQCAFYRKGGTSMPVLNRVAQVAEIQAAKHNWELIPMCHPLPLTGIDSSFHLSDQPCMVEIRAAVTCIGVTGVDSATPEMCGQAICPATVMQGEKEEFAARLSGCKNIVEAVPAGNAVTLPQWGADAGLRESGAVGRPLGRHPRPPCDGGAGGDGESFPLRRGAGDSGCVHHHCPAAAGTRRPGCSTFADGAGTGGRAHRVG